jgi:hypothetical protein
LRGRTEGGWVGASGGAGQQERRVGEGGEGWGPGPPGAEGNRGRCGIGLDLDREVRVESRWGAAGGWLRD